MQRKCVVSLLACALFILVNTCCCGSLKSRTSAPWMNFMLSPKERAKVLLHEMRADEKFNMVYGHKGPYVGNVPGNTRLHIPNLTLEDGPQGVGDGTTQVTCWPSALTVVSTWDTSLMRQFAAAMAKEQRIKGSNIMLGPMVNILRVPMEGRSFESFGEDPFLSSQMARASVSGIQSQGVMGCVKHWVDNNQVRFKVKPDPTSLEEYNRTLTSANVDERTQQEIYYPAFKAAVDQGVGSVMCSYNRVNNVYACENKQTLTVDLKERMGFQGFVMSDWGATHSTVESANSGLDMDMPNGEYFGEALQTAVNAGQVPMERVDDMVLRILTSMFAVGLFDNPQTGNLHTDARSEEHTLLARKLAIASNILLKNDKNLLPLSPASLTSVSVYGVDAFDKPTYAGFGSGHVIAPYVVTPLSAIEAYLGTAVKYIPYDGSSVKSVQEAQAAAQESDVSIVFVAVDSSEGSDRANLSLPNGQDEMVSVIAGAQPKTIVVIHSPGAVLMPWIDSVSAIIAAWLPGQEDGNAIAPILFGDVNPSGKSPLTWPTSEKNLPFSSVKQYPGVDNEAQYSNKLLVGYRWYDAKKVKPLFPFGHGLSYSTFQYTNLTINSGRNNKFTVSFDVKNAKGPAGQEVPQLYLTFPTSAGEPPKQLKGFTKISLQSGEKKSVSFTLDPEAMSIWDVSMHDWKMVTGTFSVMVGSSSRDIRLTGTFTN